MHQRRIRQATPIMNYTTSTSHQQTYRPHHAFCSHEPSPVAHQPQGEFDTAWCLAPVGATCVCWGTCLEYTWCDCRYCCKTCCLSWGCKEGCAKCCASGCSKVTEGRPNPPHFMTFQTRSQLKAFHTFTHTPSPHFALFHVTSSHLTPPSSPHRSVARATAARRGAAV
jgi:hypothetical protein